MVHAIYGSEKSVIFTTNERTNGTEKANRKAFRSIYHGFNDNSFQGNSDRNNWYLTGFCQKLGSWHVEFGGVILIRIGMSLSQISQTCTLEIYFYGVKLQKH